MGPSLILALFFKKRPARPKRDIETEFMENVFVHSDALYRYALRLAADEHRAADLVQDALIKAFDAYERLAPGSNHRAWLFTIARNAFISRHRKLSREQELESPDSLLADNPDPIALMARPNDGYRQAFDDEVFNALAELSESQRTAVVLCDVEGMSYQEISDVMDCPVGTVRSRIHHARTRLRQVLASNGYAARAGFSGKVVR